MCCIELFFNKCLWMKNCHITRERSPKKWKTCITFAIRCRNLSQITLFALKRDICLSPNDEHGSLTLAPLQGTASRAAWRSANTTRWARNVPQGNNFGRHVVRRRTQSGRGKGETEGIGGQGQGALGHSG